MPKSLMRVAVPTVVAVLSLGVSATAASASSSATSMPTFTIAYEGPLSGGNAQLGLNMEYSVELAVDQANAGTGFGKLPFKLAFKPADDQGSASQSPTTAQELVGDKSVVAVVGPAFSGATKAAEPFFSQADLATVSPSATAPELAQHGWHNFFRVVADDNAQGPADALFVAQKLHLKSVYSIDDATAYATGLVKAFDAKASALGLKVTHVTDTGTTQCQNGTGDVSEYGASATAVISSKAPIVFYAGYYCDFALLVKALRSSGYKGMLMSDDGSLDPHYVSEAGAKNANGTYISCACADLTKSVAAQPFAKSFRKLAHFPVGTYSAEAYDAANAIISVMKSLGAVKNITRAAIVKGLAKVNYKGLTKVVHFQKDGNIAGTAVYVYHVVNGKIQVIGLAP
jgi:branched-chain amino acid transport system substrate-binding protein